jgi:predicted site-specific integrase-resolvase
VSLLTQAYLLEKYGPRLTMEQLSDVLTIEPGTLYNQISAGACPVKTYREGKRRLADYRDVAAYLDQIRETAS